jgi:hypothetical protein
VEAEAEAEFCTTLLVHDQTDRRAGEEPFHAVVQVQDQMDRWERGEAEAALRTTLLVQETDRRVEEETLHSTVQVQNQMHRWEAAAKDEELRLVRAVKEQTHHPSESLTTSLLCLLVFLPQKIE